MRMFRQSGRMIAALAFLTLVPLIAHVLYSALGFNPAHDGAVLSAARRLLEGQVPHRDFIYLHPILSPLIHVPLLWLGGQQVLWLSRLFIWFQFAVIAWVWIILINRLLKNPFQPPALLTLALLAFVFSATSFPTMAWHALDGLLLATLGLALCLREKPALKMGGYFLCGGAALCKPSFAVFALVVLLTATDWRRAKYWLAAALPGILYMLFLAGTGALYDAAVQMFPWLTIRWSIRLWRFSLGMYMAVGYFAMRWIYGAPAFALPPHRRRLQAALGWLVIGLAPLFLDFKAAFNGDLDETTLNLFWTLAGVGVYFIMETDDRRWTFGRLTGWALALAWAAAVSRFSVSPAICGGILMALLVVMSLTIISSAVVRAVILILMAGLALFCFQHGRQVKIPQEVSPARLIYALDNLYPGAQGLYSGSNTYAFVADLQKAVTLAGPYAIIPDCPGYWAAAGATNPLPVDSLREAEYFNTNVLARVTSALDAGRPHLTILVQKVDANRLYHDNIIRMGGSAWNNKVVLKIQKQFKKIGETQFFELYE